MNISKILVLPGLFALAFSSNLVADEVILDDLIVNGGDTGSLCVGTPCIDGEEFGFDTIRVKSETPQIRFQDTSVSAEFPTIDWLMGITDNDDSNPAYFFIQEADSGLNALVLEPGEDGGVALGVGASVEAGAVSVGAIGDERKVTHVAEATEDTDAVNLAQFNVFVADTTANTAAEAAALEAQIDDMNTRMDALDTRLDDLLQRIDDLTPQ